MVTPEKNLVPRLGILCIEIDPRLAKMIPDLRQPAGLIVAAKSPEGQGRYIDLQSGDVIHAVNNIPVTTLDAFRARLAALNPGAPVVLLIEREGAFRYLAFEIQ
jgi:serine protease Do